MQEHELEQARNLIAATLRDKIVPNLQDYKFSVEVIGEFQMKGANVEHKLQHTGDV